MKFQVSSFKFHFFLSSIILISTPLLVLAQTTGFDPNLLISDERFSDTATLGGAEGIQKFLERQGSVLANTSADFLVKLREPDTALKSRLPDPRPNLGRLRTAAELIYDAATSAGLNPQVVLVTLHKEQSLLGGNFLTRDLQRALDRALGFGCPDEGGCGDIFLGFYHQLFGNFDASDNRFIGMPMSLMRSFNFEVGGIRVGRGPAVDALNNAYGNGNRVRTARKGDTIMFENTQGPPNNAPQYQQVTLSNFATAALYRYTPHVYNGNFNFNKFFIAWFRYPNGTLIQTAGDARVYVVDNDVRRPISSYVVTERGLNPAAVITLSALEFDAYSLGDVVPPKDGTLIKNSLGQIYLVEQGTRKLLTSFVAAQRKLNLAEAVVLPDDEITSYTDGGKALPAEGTLVKSKDNPAVYVITNNEKRLLSAFVFKQRKYSFADVLSAEAGELDGYPTGPLMAPLDGTLIKAAEEPAVYHVTNGQLQPLTFFVFTNRGFRFRDVISVPKAELATWELGKPMPPPTGLLVKNTTSPAVYYIESGTKRPISYDVFLSRKFSFKDVVVGADAEIDAIELTDDLTLPERALVKTRDSAAVYYLVDGSMRPLTYNAFINRRLRFEDVVTISPETLAEYPIGAVVEN
ncbi:MAG: hypothetical protein U1C57_00960 [Candidatus Doudnabacteria bacterium]|nr:hypothetical protein [Candidatus Doudnabacteria bacterium]